MKKQSKKKPGPNGDTLKVEGDWRDAMKVAVSKQKPVNGWPDRPIKKRKVKKRKPSPN